MLAGLSSLAGFADGTGSGTGGTGGSFTVDVSPESITKTGSTTGADKTLTTAPVTVTPHGGSGSVTYAWTRISGDAGISVTNPTAASTSFSATLGADESVTAGFQCVATDVSGAVQTAFVSVTISLVGIGGSL
jgi:hypothetical protein